MEFYYAPPEHVDAGSILLTGDESKHLVRVMRASAGDRVFVTNGLDVMFEAELSAIGKDHAACRILRRIERHREPSRDLTLAVSLLKNPARFDYLVEKAVELGARRIVPLMCERTIPKHEKHDRLQNLALAAMKQCGRSWLPPVATAEPFGGFIDTCDSSSVRLVPHEGIGPGMTIRSALHRLEDIRRMVIVIGPEGGFTEAELRHAIDAGFLPVSLGERRLRTETAAVAAVTMALDES